MIAVQSSIVRKPKMPGRSLPPSSADPFIGGMKERLPVAISSLS
jgi:hypothetical protein